MNGQLQGVLRQLSISQRLGIIGAALGAAALLAVFVMFASKPDYTTAFSSLSPADAGSISAALRSSNVPFQVTDAGTTIMVPVSALGDARMAAAKAGVITDGSGKGFELFDQSGFGMSDFDQQVTYQRAIEGELSRTIQAMDGVSTARVAVVLAQKGVLADTDTPASASVVLSMRSAGSASTGLVQAIVSTVSGAVAGLSADSVVVTDDRGHVLAGGQDTAGTTGAQAKATIEQDLESKVQGLVARALGAGHASVAVNADVDMNKVEQEITTYTPVSDKDWTPVSVHRITETYAGAAASGAGGIPGANSNIPGLPTYPGLPAATAAPSSSPGASASPGVSASPGSSAAPGASASPASNYLHQEETVNYNLSQTVQHVVQAPGVIKRLSVAVLVDQTSMGSVTLDSLKTSIQAAIGADTTRGDVVAVNAVPFAKTTAAASSAGGPDMIGQVTGMAGTAIGIVLALALLFLFWRNNAALRRRADEAALSPGSIPAGLLGGRQNPALTDGSAAEMPDPSPQTMIQERLKMVADEKPDALVGLMHGWLREEDRRR